MTTRQEFTSLKANAQRAVLFEKIDNVETQQEKQNGMVRRHEKELIAIKVTGAGLFIWVCIATGAGLPILPGL